MDFQLQQLSAALNHMKSILTIVFLLMAYFLLPVNSVKCFICDFNVNFCKDPTCYNNYDVCSANQFSSVVVPIQDCPRNCMLKAVTNPAGIVLKWKRLCAPRDDLTRGFSCRIDYLFGARIEQCTCDKDFCNGTKSLREGWWVISSTILLMAIMHVLML